MNDPDVAPRSRLAVLARRGLLRGLLTALPAAAAAAVVAEKLRPGVLGLAVGIAVVTAIAAALELTADPEEPRLHERSLGMFVLGALLFTAVLFQLAVLRRPRILSYEAHRLLELAFPLGMGAAVWATPWALATGWRVARRAGAHAAARGATSPATREWRATLVLYTVGTGGALLLVLPVVGLLWLLWRLADGIDQRLVPADAARLDPTTDPTQPPSSTPALARPDPGKPVPAG